MVVGLVTLQLFQNCFPRISVIFPVCFLVNKLFRNEYYLEPHKTLWFPIFIGKEIAPS